MICRTMYVGVRLHWCPFVVHVAQPIAPSRIHSQHSMPTNYFRTVCTRDTIYSLVRRPNSLRVDRENNWRSLSGWWAKNLLVLLTIHSSETLYDREIATTTTHQSMRQDSELLRWPDAVDSRHSCRAHKSVVDCRVARVAAIRALR